MLHGFYQRKHPSSKISFAKGKNLLSKTVAVSGATGRRVACERSRPFLFGCRLQMRLPLA
ncbi:MAG: hypothetical protein DME79_09195 [Verrucomicrobia bacterium]|nr:MAG: hypothetical protein DME79_09195 [Verrucomicrobiota bacterium]